MAEQTAAFIKPKETSIETPYERQLKVLLEEAKLSHVPDYRVLVRNLVNDRLREVMALTHTDPEQLDTEYNKTVEEIQSTLEKDPDAVVDIVAARINEVPMATKSPAKPIKTENVLRLLAANNRKGQPGQYPWSHHEQLVGAFKGDSKDGYAGYDPRALLVQRMIHNDEAGRATTAPQAPIKVSPSK